MIGLLIFVVTSCHAGERPIGMSLLFQGAGHEVIVQRFDPDGRRGPVPGSVGGMSPRSGKQMSFMPGDSQRAVPQFVDVAWVERTAEFSEWIRMDELRPREEQYSPMARAEYKIAWAKQPHHTRRVDLTPILKPELLAQVRKDYRNTQLTLIITFNNDQVDIQAVAKKWR